MASSSSLTSLFLLILLLGSALYICNAASGLPELPNLTTLSFEEGYTQLFGDSNLRLHGDGRNIHISLDQRTGAGFASQDLYLHGFFSGSIKLPSDYAAGVVVAFYMSNGDIFEKTHDELDFEFLGNIRGREWRVQTNVYGNGSISTGREERYELWFDPTEDYHQYSILWSSQRIIFYIDNIPIRELVKSQIMGGDYPAKPMSLYATIWDGSTWATSGGRYKVNYKFAPYTAEFADLMLHGCAANPSDHKTICMGNDDVYNGITMSADQRLLMEKFRKKRITYSYCHDRIRYPTPPPECILGPEAEGFLASGEAKFSFRRRRGRHYTRSSVGMSF
ncbi:probable xyloglucan endotransglucosylase/hydrolase protein 28 [Zingiber officinale]|uniref:probable xyloglucan endotransglucosylase/hydrolase protein 28 n=1 Tax=Zingiber officinale TaxID=94328 RepID=UPI001C4C2C1E|nr:probable xyloglucan endotransglucosylase/hydrolase protein 28 [Zingiber officinale]